MAQEAVNKASATLGKLKGELEQVIAQNANGKFMGEALEEARKVCKSAGTKLKKLQTMSNKFVLETDGAGVFSKDKVEALINDTNTVNINLKSCKKVLLNMKATNDRLLD